MSDDAGFTLVELLFALVAGSLLLVSLGWAINELTRELRRTEVIGGAEMVDAATPFLSREIGHAIPLARGAILAGNDHALALGVPPPKALGAIGPVRLRLDVETRSDGDALVAWLLPSADDQALPGSARVPTILASGFRSIRFRYLRRASDRPDRLPRLIDILFVAKDGTLLPLALEPRLGMGTDCVFDPISLTCRP